MGDGWRGISELSPMRWLWLMLAAAGLVSTSACSSLSYYGQSVFGHLTLLGKRVPVAEVAADEAADASLRGRLRSADEIRSFASDNLGLPNNRSYRDYVDVGRDYVVWNVVVTPALSLRPQQWCFVVVGCVAYRGYYEESSARAFAEEWRHRGFDVAVGGVRAYSTLGWLSDPLLSTMLVGPETYTAGIIFHELAHQVVYIQDDTAFNEGFAVAVEREGVKRWVRERGDRTMWERYLSRRARHEEFVRLALAARSDLAAIYASDRTESAKVLEKQERFRALRDEYRRRRAGWGGYTGYDAWLASDLNNAKLALLATYHDKVPAFTRLLELEGGDLEKFFAAVEALGELPKADRDSQLARLLSTSSAHYFD